MKLVMSESCQPSKTALTMGEVKVTLPELDIQHESGMRLGAGLEAGQNCNSRASSGNARLHLTWKLSPE